MSEHFFVKQSTFHDYNILPLVFLIGLYALAKTFRQANELQKAMRSLFSIIQLCGEELPLPMGNEKLDNDINTMNQILQNTSGGLILSMNKTENSKVVVMLKVFAELANLLVFTDPILIGAISLRMIDLTLKSGLTCECPLAFAFYAMTLMSMGGEHTDEACRLGEWDQSNCNRHAVQSILIQNTWLLALLHAMLLKTH